ncbi:MAG: hypothetical protein KGD67_13270 [Candidatus Lokiarchaeota archaeon]|nr:hypothetical protein [Candidatus Lokiarchaeota archaeon]
MGGVGYGTYFQVPIVQHLSVLGLCVHHFGYCLVECSSIDTDVLFNEVRG